MRRFFNFFFFVLTSILPFNPDFPIIPDIPDIKIPLCYQSFSMSPLNVEGIETYGTVSFKNSFNSGISEIGIDVYLLNDLYPDGIKIYEWSGKAQSKVISFKYNNEYTRLENSIHYDIFEDSNKFSYDFDIALARPTAKVISSDSNVFKSENKIYSDNAFNRDSYETLRFNGFEDLYIPDYYHRLDLDDFSITQDCGLVQMPLQYSTIRLLITNRDGVFDDLFGKGEYASIPLTLVNENNVYRLSFENRMFVNKHTLRMSSEQKEDYVETRHLYFPRNEMKYQGDYNCVITFDNLGVDLNKYVYSFKLHALINTLGNCIDSEYCERNR